MSNFLYYFLCRNMQNFCQSFLACFWEARYNIKSQREREKYSATKTHLHFEKNCGKKSLA